MFFGKNKKDAGKPTLKGKGGASAPVPPEVQRDPIVLEFRADGSGVPYLSSGWSKPEAKSVWSVGDRATVDISALMVGRRAGGCRLNIAFSAYLKPPSHASQQVDLFVGGTIVGSWDITDGKPAEYEVHIPESALRGEETVLDFRIAKPTSPATVNPASKDARALGIALSSITIS